MDRHRDFGIAACASLMALEAIETTMTIGEKKPPKPATPTRSDIPPGTLTRQQRRFAERRGKFLEPQDDKGEGL